MFSSTKTVITNMKNLTLEQRTVLNHESLLNYQISNLYKHAKPQQHSRRLSDPVNTQIYIHSFNRVTTLPPIDMAKSQKRSMSLFTRRPKDNEKKNQTDLKSRRFETLPSDIECVNKFPTEENRKVVTSREEVPRKKQFIEIDMLSLFTWYAKNDTKVEEKKTKEKLDMKQQIKEITTIPTKAKIATFIQNYSMKNEHIDIDDLVRHPNFGVNYKEKQYLYFGELRNNQMDGKGVMINRNWIFEGIWGRSHRLEGVQITPKGIYTGKFINDERSKVGQFFWNNGEYYSGQWFKNKKHGTGVWKSKNGDVYMGQWVKGKVEGYGSHLTKAGQKYEGFFFNFLKHGEGKQYFPNGDFFQGTFKEGRPHGIGTYKWKNGLVYEGQFLNGYRNGKGIIKKLGIQYEGTFLKQKAHGQGKLTIYNGDNFKGSFKKGKKQGKGVQKQSKCIYIGTWHDNKFVQKQQ